MKSKSIRSDRIVLETEFSCGLRSQFAY